MRCQSPYNFSITLRSGLPWHRLAIAVADIPSRLLRSWGGKPPMDLPLGDRRTSHPRGVGGPYPAAGGWETRNPHPAAVGGLGDRVEVE